MWLCSSRNDEWLEYVCTCNNYENLQIGKVDPWEISSRFASFVVYLPIHFEQTHSLFYVDREIINFNSKNTRQQAKSFYAQLNNRCVWRKVKDYPFLFMSIHNLLFRFFHLYCSVMSLLLSCAHFVSISLRFTRWNGKISVWNRSRHFFIWKSLILSIHHISIFDQVIEKHEPYIPEIEITKKFLSSDHSLSWHFFWLQKIST